jgi:MFS family permease
MKLYYGWVIVAVGVVVTCIGLGTMMSLGVFLQPMSAAMGWSRAGISTAALLSFLFMGAGSLLWGALSDRFGTRAVVLCGGLLLGAGLVSASQATTLLQFQLLFGVAVGLAAGSFFAPLTATTTHWFTEHRSLAVALVSAGTGIGSMTVAPLAQWMIDLHGWRTAMAVLGGIAWLVVLSTGLLLRRPPATHEAAAAMPGGGAWTVAHALRTPQFAAIALTFFACCAAHSGPIFHMVSYVADCGIPAMAAATVFGAAGVGALAGRIICGLIADRTGAKETLVAGLLLQAVSISLYLVIRDLTGFYGVALLFGFAYGGVMPLYAILVRQYFGAEIMGTIFGAVAMVSTLGMALGPWAGGWLYDSYGSYFWLYVSSAGIGLGAAAIAFAFRPPQVANEVMRPALA